MDSAILNAYLGRGLDASKPDPTIVAVGAETARFYYATDTQKLYALNAAANAWVWINSGGGGGGGGSVDSVGVTSPLANTGTSTNPVIAISNLSKAITSFFSSTAPNPVSQNVLFQTWANSIAAALNQIIAALKIGSGCYGFFADNRSNANQNWLLIGKDGPATGSEHGSIFTMNLLTGPPPTVDLVITPTSSTMRHAVRNDSGRIVATATNSITAYSDDEGATWTQVPLSGSTDIIWIDWDGTNFVACGTGGFVGTSPDGITWTTQTISSENLYCVVNYRGRLVITGNGTESWISTDHGVTWTAGGTLPSNKVWHGSQVDPATGNRVICGGVQPFGGGSGPNFAYSTDGGVTWTGATVGDWYWTGVAWSPDSSMWTAMDATGKIATSTDGLTWTFQADLPIAGGTRIEYNAGLWVCGGGTQDVGKMCYTNDPIAGTWTVVLTDNMPVQAMLILP